MKKLLLLFFALLCLTGTAKAATPELSFDELYSGGGVLGLQFSDKVEGLSGQRVIIKGFMAPPLRPGPPSSHANPWLCARSASQTRTGPTTSLSSTFPQPELRQNNSTIEVEGVLEIGSHRDADTGFISQLRLRDARFRKL